MTMHVLHVVESLRPDAGSVAVSLRGLFDALQTRAIESEVVTLDPPGVAPSGVQHTTFAPNAGVRLARAADVIHLHGWGTELARNMAGAAARTSSPYVISALGGLSEGPYHQKSWRDKLRGFLGENKLIRGAAAVTAYNAAEHQALSRAGVSANIQSLPYGLDVAEYEGADILDHDLPASPDGRCLLLLGPIHPVEGFVPLMKAFAEVGADADGWNIVLAGREVADWRKMLEAAVRRKGGGDRVMFAPAADVARQRAWLARASVLASPSLHFRPPVSIMQAVAAGVPVIASERAAPDGLNGAIRACPPSREALRKELRAIFQLTDEERASLARKAREVGRTLFDWSVRVEQFARLYQTVA